MKVLLSWLREFAPLEGSPADLAHDLSDLGLTVEEMADFGADLHGVVVARVAALRPHPSADRIGLVDVEQADGKVVQVCCGAFNMAVGDLVPLAVVGSTLPGGRRIGRRKMRGEWSEGMLCSPAELGMGTDQSGILILPEGLTLGEDLSSALGLSEDVLFDLEVNPNRPDALSVAGVARDLAARRRVPFALPEPRVSTSGESVEASVEILDPDLCGRFSVTLLRGVDAASSPSPLLTHRLLAAGMRPVNPVVDVSNYVMLELGQPSHAFDADLVPGHHFRVRRAAAGETIVTLDALERTLESADGVIANSADEPIGIAGVMGGASTEVSTSTKSILLEAAWWQPSAIAATSRRLGLRSEASARFEAGVDPEIAERALMRFAELSASFGVAAAPGLVEAEGNLPPPARVRLRTARVNSILGTRLARSEVRECLESIGFVLSGAGAGEGAGADGDARAGDALAGADGGEAGAGEAGAGVDWDVDVPSWRPDTSSEIDLIEEVGRLWGFGRIPRTVPPSPRTGGLSLHQRRRRQVLELLAGMGLMQAMPLPFLAPGDLERCGLAPDGIELSNPLVAEESVLRTSLRPGLLAAVSYNAARRRPGVRLFEVGSVWSAEGGEDGLPNESDHLGVALAGEEAPAAVGVWRSFQSSLPLAEAELVNAPVAGLHGSRSAVIRIGSERVGVVGEVALDVLGELGIPERVAWLECDLGALLRRHVKSRSYSSPSRFPSSDFDLSFVLADSVPASSLESALREAGADLLAQMQLFDVFRSERLGEGCRSLTWRLRLQASDRTLTDAEVSEVRSACIAAALRTGAELRA